MADDLDADVLLALDGLVHEAVRLCLQALPPESRTPRRVRRELLRMTRRALQNLDDDRAVFATRRDEPPAPRRKPAPTRHGRPWTASEDALLRERYEATPDVRAVAREHQRSASSVRSRLMKLGVIPPAVAPDAPEEGS